MGGIFSCVAIASLSASTGAPLSRLYFFVSIANGTSCSIGRFSNAAFANEVLVASRV